MSVIQTTWCQLEACNAVIACFLLIIQTYNVTVFYTCSSYAVSISATACIFSFKLRDAIHHVILATWNRWKMPSVPLMELWQGGYGLWLQFSFFSMYTWLCMWKVGVAVKTLGLMNACVSAGFDVRDYRLCRLDPALNTALGLYWLIFGRCLCTHFTSLTGDEHSCAKMYVFVKRLHLSVSVDTYS